MIKNIAILILTLKSFTYAKTDPRIRPYLNFSLKNVKTHSIVSPYLFVVPEDWSFPSSDDSEATQKKKFIESMRLLEEVVNSLEFKNKVLSYTRSDGKMLFRRNFLWNDDQKRLSNNDVFKIILKAQERTLPQTKREININAFVKKCKWHEKRKTWCRKVIGSTFPHSSKWIKLNWKFYKNFDTPQMVGNLMHEWLHLLGFLHGKHNVSEEVPYVVGKIAENIARKLY